MVRVLAIELLNETNVQMIISLHLPRMTQNSDWKNVMKLTREGIWLQNHGWITWLAWKRYMPWMLRWILRCKVRKWRQVRVQVTRWEAVAAQGRQTYLYLVKPFTLSVHLFKISILQEKQMKSQKMYHKNTITKRCREAQCQHCIRSADSRKQQNPPL